MKPKKFIKFILLAPLFFFMAIYVLYLFKTELFYFRGWEYFDNLVYTKGSSHKIRLNESGDATRKYLIQRYNKFNIISTNDLGNRIACYDSKVKKPQSILMIGDSQLFGSGLDDSETLSRILCNKFNVNLYNASRKNQFNLLRIQEFNFDSIIIVSSERTGIKRFCNLLKIYNHEPISKNKLKIKKKNIFSFFNHNRKYLSDYLQSRLDVLFNLKGNTKAPIEFVFTVRHAHNQKFIDQELDCAKKINSFMKNKKKNVAFIYIPSKQTLLSDQMNLRLDDLTENFISIVDVNMKKNKILSMDSKKCLIKKQNKNKVDIIQIHDSHLNAYGIKLLSECIEQSELKKLFALN